VIFDRAFNLGFINIKVVGNQGKGIKARISASVVSGGMISGGYTNRDGHGVLEWKSNNLLNVIYINGKAYKGKYRSGETYIFKK